jgi:hypothetical protein
MGNPSLLEKRLSGIAELRYAMFYGKSQNNEQRNKIRY